MVQTAISAGDERPEDRLRKVTEELSDSTDDLKKLVEQLRRSFEEDNPDGIKP